jgi:hypothetical protein
MSAAQLIFWILAGICFVIATFKWIPKWEIGWAGAFFVVLAVLVPQL